MYLRRDYGLAEDAPAAHNVLREELPHDDAYVGRVDLHLMHGKFNLIMNTVTIFIKTDKLPC